MSRPQVVAVNDDPVQLGQIAGVLRGKGYEVNAFESSTDALKELAGHAPADLFVLDLHMPTIDGWKLCRLLRSPEFEAFNEVPIMVVSATYGGEQVAALTRELGADGFLEAPFNAEDLVDMAGKLLARQATARTPSALIVEDDVSVRRALARCFEHHGYRVVEEDTVLGARRTWREVRPDVVLLDHHLPDGNSFDLLDELADRRTRTSVLVMTGDTDPLLPVRFFDHGSDGYLRKPFEPDHAVKQAESVGRQRALLRIGSNLEIRHEEERFLERRQHHRRRLESLGLLAGGIAHEFNNLLVGILGNADLAALDIPEDSPAHGPLEQVGRLARRAAERTRQILAFTGKARLQLEELDPGDLIERVLRGMDPALAAAVRVVESAHVPRLLGDPERLAEVIVSLVMNGVEALPGGRGQVSMTVGLREVRATERLQVEGGGDVQPGRYVLLEVVDDGIGMDEATRARMFDPFFSTKFTGRGLGLAAVLGIVRAHGGWITVRSTPGAGTAVGLLFPAAPLA